MSVKIHADKHIVVRRRVAEKTHCRYFSLRVRENRSTRAANKTEVAKQLRAARAYDAELEQLQQAREPAPWDPFHTSVRNNTGVRGISWREQVRPDGKVRAFFVCCTTPDNKVWSRYYQTSTMGWTRAWHAAVEDIVRCKQLDERTRTLLRQRVPPKSIALDPANSGVKKARALVIPGHTHSSNDAHWQQPMVNRR